MSCSYLIDQALSRIWSSPRQDTQSITKPRRITSMNGVWNTIYVSKDQYVLPERNVRFHVYQIGQLYPLLMGFFPRQDKWITLADCCNKQKMICNVYSQKGIEMPRYETWYLVTPDRNLLIAVKEQTSIDIDLSQEDIYLRVYSNSFFQGRKFDETEDFIKVVGKTITKNSDMVDMIEVYNQYRNQPMALPYLYINGRKSEVLNQQILKIGDTVEIVYDSSIYRYVEFPIKDLRTFDSIKDNKRKYLLHYNTPMLNSDQIDFHDDIDFYIVRKDPKGVLPLKTGFYYHRNKEDAARNITHRDYSLTVPYVTDYTNQTIPYYMEDPSIEGWVVQMYVRHGGWDRNLQYVHNRIKELYKLPDREVLRALHGVDSMIPEWRADNLENSDYMKVMSHPNYNLDQLTVENAFGYNAVSKMIAETPSKVIDYSERKAIKLPLIYRRLSTAYEYDANGKLVNYALHNNGEYYNVKSNSTKLVEMIGGVASQSAEEYYNQKFVKYNSDYNYRFYKRPKNPTDGIKEWKDITGEIQFYILDKEAKQIQWTLDMDEWDVLVRTDNGILMQEIDDMVRDGLIYFKLAQTQSRDGTSKTYVQEIPFGEIEVWLNGYSLVEGIDYFVDFPNVCIVNKHFLIDPKRKRQHITVRQYGHPTKDFRRNPVEDTGWVRYGVLSRNNKFDIRDDRVMRMTVGGSFIHRDDLSYSETDTGVHVRNDLNGKPYCIKDIMIPTRNIITAQDPYEYRDRSVDLDNRISDYMTQFIREPEKEGASATPFLWPVYSPFCSKIIFDLINGVLDTEPLKEFYDDNFVLEYTKKYNYLLRVDPAHDDHLFDKDYMIVHPTHLSSVVDLNAWQYKFVERVIKIVLHNRVDLTGFARIVA